jgi:hypothetical protein
VYRIIDSMTKLLPGLVLTVVIFGAIPALAITVNTPAAMATPLWAQDPPQPPQLSDEERQALADRDAGTLKKEQQGALNRAEKKQETAEKYQGKRNQQKQRGGPRRR